MAYIVYCDEAGQLAAAFPTVTAAENGRTEYTFNEKERYLFLSAAIVHSSNLNRTTTRFKKWKYPWFPVSHEVKGRDLRSLWNGKAVNGVTLDSEQIQVLKDSLPEAFPEPVSVACVAIDKIELFGRYPDAWPPYVPAFGVLANICCAHLPGTDEIIFALDEQSEVLKYLETLHGYAVRLKPPSSDGSHLKRLIREPMMVDSKFHSGIQIADLVATAYHQKTTKPNGISLLHSALVARILPLQGDWRQRDDGLVVFPVKK